MKMSGTFIGDSRFGPIVVKFNSDSYEIYQEDGKEVTVVKAMRPVLDFYNWYDKNKVETFKPRLYANQALQELVPKNYVFFSMTTQAMSMSSRFYFSPTPMIGFSGKCYTGHTGEVVRSDKTMELRFDSGNPKVKRSIYINVKHVNESSDVNELVQFKAEAEDFEQITLKNFLKRSKLPRLTYA